MSGIAGFMDISYHFLEQEEKWREIVNQMAMQTNRGEQAQALMTKHYAASCVNQKKEPAAFLEQSRGGNRYLVVFDGELTNRDTLYAELKGRGYSFQSRTDTEIALITYMQFGENCAQKLEGIYAFAVWDDARQRCFLCRDRMGGRKLCFAQCGTAMAFSSTPTGLFAFPGIRQEIGRKGWCALLAAAPLLLPEESLFQGVSVLPPGHAIVWEQGESRIFPYFALDDEEHPDNYDKTVRTARDLLFDAVTARLENPEHLGVWLDRRADAGLVTAVAAGNLTKRLHTFSLEPPDETGLEDGAALGVKWPDLVSGVLRTDHHNLIWENSNIADALYHAVAVGCLPGTCAEFSAVFFQLCNQMKEKHQILLTGACGRPLFGQCSWTEDEPSSRSFLFHSWEKRRGYFQQDWIYSLQPEEYLHYLWETALERAPKSYGETGTVRTGRQEECLSAIWSLRTALELADCLGNSTGLSIRTPMADARLVQYLLRIPAEIKWRGGRKDVFLRDVMRGLLPDSLFPREKSALVLPPQGYGVLIRSRLAAILADRSQPLHTVIDAGSIQNLMKEPLSSVSLQNTSYFLQLNEWMRAFHLAP